VRFALVTADYQPAAVACGVGDYTRCLRRALEELGHPCLVLTSARSHSGEPDVQRLAGRWGPRETLAAWRALRRWRPDVVSLQYTPDLYGYGVAFKLLPLLLRWTRGSPRVVTTFHTLVGGRRVSGPYAALLAASSHGVVSTNAELTELFRRRLPWWKGKLREIPIGASIPEPRVDRSSARRSLRERLGQNADATVLGAFGFPAPGKGLETLVQAMAALNESSEVHLAVIGETRPGDRAHRAMLDRRARDLRVDGRIHWLGRLPEQEVSDLLLGADAYVVPYDDGASLRRGTLIAGFRVGVPIVTTPPRYPDPALSPGETILTVPPRSPGALAAEIRRLLTDPHLQERLRKGSAAAAARFEWPAIAADYVAVGERLRGKEDRVRSERT
jgi:glycosyltransferase involved in cell wall biosynthesis